MNLIVLSQISIYEDMQKMLHVKQSKYSSNHGSEDIPSYV